MNIFQKYTWRSLRANKVRTVVTIIGIALSVSLFTAVTTSISSVQQYLLQVVAETEGSWHLEAECGYSDEEREELLKTTEDERVDRWGVVGMVEFAKLDKVVKKNRPYLEIMGYCGDFPEFLSLHLTEGRMPENSSELILPAELKRLDGQPAEAGESVELLTGARRLKDSGDLIWQDGEFEKNQEEFVSHGKKTFRIVGFYECANWAGERSWRPGWNALTKVDESALSELNGIVHSYVTLKDPSAADAVRENWEEGAKESLDEHMFVVVNKNYSYLSLMGYGEYDGVEMILLLLLLVLLGIIMFGSIFLIYNSFSISINERKKQYGLLSSLGATRKQLRSSILFEAAAVSLAGIPLGVLLGLGGMGVTFYFLQDEFSLFAGSVTGQSGMTIHLSAALWAVALAAALGFATVLISAWLPARKAMKLNAVEAIRQTEDIAVKPRRLRTSRLTKKLFGLEGVLASKNYKRSRRKYRATVLSLFVSVVLFVSASSLCDYMSIAVQAETEDYAYDIQVSCLGRKIRSGKPEEVFHELSEADGVTESSYYYEFMNMTAVVPEKNLTDMARKQSADTEEKGKKVFFNTHLIFVEDEEFEAFLSEQGEDPSRYMNPEKPMAAVCDLYKTMDEESEKIVIGPILNESPETIELAGFEDEDGEAAEPRELTIGAVMDEVPDPIRSSRGIGLILYYPMSAMKAVLPENSGGISQTGAWCYMNFNSDDPKRTETAMETIREDNYHIYNKAEELRTSRAGMTVLNVFSYGFIVLISLIALANVFNTISTNVMLRKREFAMLRSVGMTWKGLRRMSYFECLLYGMKGLVYGLPVSLGVVALMWKATAEGMEISFYVPWYTFAIAAGSVFAVVFATMIYAIRKIRRDNVVDVLKEEIY